MLKAILIKLNSLNEEKIPQRLMIVVVAYEERTARLVIVNIIRIAIR